MNCQMALWETVTPRAASSSFRRCSVRCEVCSIRSMMKARCDGDQPRKIGLRHPQLADHPYVRHVEEALGFEIDRNSAPNRHGSSSGPTARWRHAVDLNSPGKLRELLDTREFTERGCIMNAVAYGCRYSHHEDKKASGYITTTEAHEIMREVGATEPDERGAIIRAFSAPTVAVRTKAASIGRSIRAACALRMWHGASFSGSRTAGSAMTVLAIRNGPS
jgi:hypothetical protein